MNYDNEIEIVWVEFAGGPLDDQCRNLPRAQTHLQRVVQPTEEIDLTKPYSEISSDMFASVVTYKIERSWRKGPGYFRESFKGVLI